MRCRVDPCRQGELALRAAAIAERPRRESQERRRPGELDLLTPGLDTAPATRAFGGASPRVRWPATSPHPTSLPPAPPRPAHRPSSRPPTSEHAGGACRAAARVLVRRRTRGPVDARDAARPRPRHAVSSPWSGPAGTGRAGLASRGSVAAATTHVKPAPAPLARARRHARGVPPERSDQRSHQTERMSGMIRAAMPGRSGREESGCASTSHSPPSMSSGRCSPRRTWPPP